MGDEPRLPRLTGEETRKALRKLGFQDPAVRGATSHVTMTHLGPPKRHATVVLGHKGELPEGTLRGILAQAQVGVSDLLIACGGSRKRAEKQRLKNLQRKRS